MSAGNIRAIARIVAKKDKVQETRALLIGLVDATRREPGCVSYELLQHRSDPTVFAVVEAWRSENDFNAHFTTPHVKAAFQKAPELLAGPPEIGQYNVVS